MSYLLGDLGVWNLNWNLASSFGIEYFQSEEFEILESSSFQSIVHLLSQITLGSLLRFGRDFRSFQLSKRYQNSAARIRNSIEVVQS